MLVSPTLYTSVAYTVYAIDTVNDTQQCGCFSVVSITSHYAGTKKITQNSLRTVGGTVAGAKDEKKEGIQIMEFNTYKFYVIVR